MRGLELVDVGQHLRQGDVQDARHLVAHLDVAEQHAGERRCRDDRNATLGADLADPCGDFIGALGHDNGSGVPPFLVRAARPHSASGW
jgi:hypothetical protein